MAVDSGRMLERRASVASEVSLFVKYILFFLNVLFWILGAVMIAIGVYAKTEKSYGTVGKALPWYMDPANIFIILGSIIFVLAFLGCIGSLRENIALLRTFEYTIDILLLLEIAIAVYVYLDRSRVRRGVEGVLKDTIPKYRDDPDLQSIMDFVQQQMQCCGITDFNNWESNIYFNCSITISPERCGVPFSCCKNYKLTLNTQCGYNVRSPALSNVQRSERIYTEGCVEATFNFFLKQDNLILLVCVGGSMILLQLVATGLAHHLVDGIRRQKARWMQPGSGLQNPGYDG